MPRLLFLLAYWGDAAVSQLLLGQLLWIVSGLSLVVDVLYHVEIEFVLFLDLLANILSIIVCCHLIELQVVFVNIILANLVYSLLLGSQ